MSSGPKSSILSKSRLDANAPKKSKSAYIIFTTIEIPRLKGEYASGGPKENEVRPKHT